ncbi:MAG: catalase [Lachnospiraceae bacterium]|nr:catalase [Lachnospiraceae bacterium]
MKAINHFKTITTHKLLVMKYCFKVGLIKQGICHDLSKYSPVEFINGCLFYQGYRSPNVEERNVKGYSTAWIHHKGRNKHHFEYWNDYSNKPGEVLVAVKMPEKYLYEMFIDRLVASKVYKGDEYTDSSALEYYEAYKDRHWIHKDTRRSLEKLLHMLNDRGEEYTLKYIRVAVIKMRIRKIRNLFVGLLSKKIK